MYLYVFAIVAAGLVNFLYDSWWRAAQTGAGTLVLHVGSIDLLMHV